jgi:alanyl-tRNA synthetase
MGLERIAVVMQDVNSIFDVDTIKIILDAICKKANVVYGHGKNKQDISLRIITDHLRSLCFMIADGILPSNEGRGYVLRRLLRRAARHGRLLGIQGTFLSELSEIVVKVSGDAYPELVEKRDYIKKIIDIEEDKFASTIDQGEAMINDAIKDMKKEGKTVLSGEAAFKLYDTYGFPLELTQEILEESGLKTDIDEFKSHMDKQRKQARAARKSGEDKGWSDSGIDIELDCPTQFVGYDSLDNIGKVLHIFKDNLETGELQQGDTGRIICDETPFYAEGGGQSTDTGIMYNDGCSLEVLEVTKIKGAIVHKVACLKGQVKLNDHLTCLVSLPRRFATARNHTATHLLHKALREVLGDHVQQAGSQVTADGLRFDFNHYQGLTPEELQKVEGYVNNAIDLFPKVSIKEITMKQATEEGITALFGEKYGEWVRVVSVENFSQELCGGTHVKNVGEIGSFMIQSEAGVASGVRRIEAVTGRGVLKAAKASEAVIENAAAILKVTPNAITQKIQTVTEEIKSLKKEAEEHKKASLGNSMDQIIQDSKLFNGVRLITQSFEDYTIQDLRGVSDDIKASQKETVMVLATTSEDKVTFMVAVTDDLLDKGYHAGKMIKEIATAAGGSGGGKADMAQAGAKDPSKITEAFKVAEKLVESKA